MPTSRIPALYTRLARDDAPPRIASTTPASTLAVRGSGVEGTAANGPHVLTVALEDYYHVGAFNRLIQRGQWYRFERRIERATERTLDLLDEYGASATFFVLGWVADTLPELVKQVTQRGHEVASKGYYHRNVRQLTPGEFRDDLARSREAIERAAGQRVRGYRVADQWFRPTESGNIVLKLKDPIPTKHLRRFRPVVRDGKPDENPPASLPTLTKIDHPVYTNE